MRSSQRIRQTLQRYQRKPVTQQGILGNAVGEISVPNRVDYVYVRVAGLGTISIYNKRVPLILDLPVDVGYDPLEPKNFQVLNIHRYPQGGGRGLVDVSTILHGKTHNWGGIDPVFIEKRQLMPLRPTPLGGMGLYVTREVTYYDDKAVQVTGQQLDLAPYVPATGSWLVLVYKDTDELIKVSTGGVLRDIFTLSLADAPQVYPGTVPIALIRLYGGQSGIAEGYQDTDLIDVRQLFSPVLTGTFSGGGGGHVIQDEGVSRTQRTKLNFKGASVWAIDNAGADSTDIIISGTSSGMVTGTNLDWFNVQDYGAVGNGVADDTTAIQAAIDAAELVNGVVYLPEGTYKLTAGLTIDNPITLLGSGIHPLHGSVNTDMNSINIPVDSPYLEGAVLLMTAVATDVITLAGAGKKIDLRHFGIRFATPYVNTGHGIRYLPPATGGHYDNGLMDAEWDDLVVFGHDGNHYAYVLTNTLCSTFQHLRSFGGGGLYLEGDGAIIGGYQMCYGGAVFNHFYAQDYVDGTAHGIFIVATAATLFGNFSFIRLQCTVSDMSATTGATPPGNDQYIFNYSGGVNVYGCSFIGSDFETNVGSPCSFPENSFIDPVTLFGPAVAFHSAEIPAIDFKATGMTGATAASRYVGATASGAPGSGTFLKGDFVIDQTGKVWVCTTAGSPGVWTVAAGAGNVLGPGLSTDNAITRFNGVDGVHIQNSNASLDDNGSINIPTGQTYNINGSPHTHVGAVVTGAHTIMDEGTTLPYQPVLNFIGNSLWAVNNAGQGRIDIIVSGTSSGGGHTIEDEGTPLTQRTKLNFVGASVNVTDDAGNDATIVTISNITGTGSGDVTQSGAVTVEHLAVFAADKQIKDGGAVPAGAGTDGWVAAGQTWTYEAGDDPTYTFSEPVDATGKYSPGMKIKCTQGGSVKYGIVTAVGAYSGGKTIITVYCGTDYDLGATITNPYYSTSRAPVGFPLDPTKWTVELGDTSNRQQAAPVNGTWYNLGSLTISIPIGCWRTQYQVQLSIYKAANADYDSSVTLSTANNSQSDADLTANNYFGNCYGGMITTVREKYLSMAAKTSLYLNAMTNWGGGASVALQFRGDISKTIIRAICAYL